MPTSQTGFPDLATGGGGTGNAVDVVLDDASLVVVPVVNMQAFAEGVDHALFKARGTGVATSYVGVATVGGTTFDMPEVFGEINGDLGYFDVHYAGATGVTVANLNAQDTYVYIDSAGLLQQQTTSPTRQDWARKMFVMRIAVDTTANTILGFEYLNNPIGHYANSLRDLYTFLLAQGVPFKRGQVITGRAGDLGFDVSAGELLEFGGTGDINNANIKSFSLATNVTYSLLSQTAVVGDQTNLVKFWDNATTITALGSTTVVGHRLYRFSNGTFAMQYGQGNYANIDLAKAGVANENYELNPRLKNATFFGWWFIEETAANTGGNVKTDFIEYTLGIAGGSSGSLAGAALTANNGSDFANLATFRQNVGLEIGVDVAAFGSVGGGGTGNAANFASSTPVTNATSWNQASAVTPGTGGAANTTLIADNTKGIIGFSTVGTSDVVRFENPAKRPTLGADFDHVFNLSLLVPDDNFAFGGIYVEASATNKVYAVGKFYNGEWYRQYWNNNSFGAEALLNNQHGFSNGDSFNGYVRLARVGTSLFTYISMDGLSWLQIAAETISTHLGDIDRIGLLYNASGQAANTPALVAVLGHDDDGPQARALSPVQLVAQTFLIKAQYWRVTSMEQTASNGRSLAEIAFREAVGGSDTAPASVSAFSTFSSFVAGNAVDGNAATIWSSDGSNVGEWFRAAFSAPVNIAEIEITARNDASHTQAPQRFGIEYSYDDTTWYRAGTTIEALAAYTAGSVKTFNLTTQTVAASVNNDYDLRFGFIATPTTDEVIETLMIVREVTLPASLTGSVGIIGTNPTGSFVLSLQDDAVEIATITIATNGAYTFATIGGVSKVIAAGSALTLVAPTGVDATAANATFTLLGSS
jgi:hypothetical protein